MSVFKKLNPDDVTITPFKLYKSKQFTESDLSTFGIQEKYARLRIINTGSEDTLSAKNINDLKTKNIVYNQINHLYYNNDYVPFYDTFGNIDPQNTERKLFGEANIISINRNLYGYKIKPETVYISGSFNSDTISVELKDDGKGNIYDSGFNTASFMSNDNRVLYLDFKNQLDKIDEFKSS